MKTRIGAAIVAITVSAFCIAQTAAPVAFAGKTLFTIRASADGMSAEQRAMDVEKRMIDILSFTSIKDKDVVAKLHGTNYDLLVKSKLLVTVTPADAATYAWPISKVANHWRNMVAAEIPRMHLLPEQVNARAKKIMPPAIKQAEIAEAKLAKAKAGKAKAAKPKAQTAAKTKPKPKK